MPRGQDGHGARRSPGAAPGTAGDEAAQVADLYRAGLSTRRIAERTGLGRRRVTALLEQEGVEIAPRGRGRPRRPPYLHPQFEEVRRLYLEEGCSSTVVSEKLGLPGRSVRDLLARSGTTLRHRGGFDRKDRMPLSKDDLAALYVDAGTSAAQAARSLGVSHNTLLRAAHSVGLPVRDVAGPPDSPDRTVVLLDALYKDCQVRVALRRHRVPVVRRPGPLHERFPEPCAVGNEVLRDLYEDCGLSAFHIELVTGHPAATVRRRLRQAGVRLRPRGGRSPFGRRVRGLTVSGVAARTPSVARTLPRP